MKLFIGKYDKEILRSSGSRKSLIEQATNLYFVTCKKLTNEYFVVYESFPFSTYQNTALIIGHNVDINIFIKTYCNSIKENNIYILTCNYKLLLNQINKSKNIFLSKQLNNHVFLRNGYNFGLDFLVTDTELNILNDRRSNFEEILNDNFIKLTISEEFK